MSGKKKTPAVNSQTILEDGIALCTFKTARVTAEPTTMPIRHADTTKIATRFAFTCSTRFNLKDNSDYEKTVDKQSREKITPEKTDINEKATIQKSCNRFATILQKLKCE